MATLTVVGGGTWGRAWASCAGAHGNRVTLISRKSRSELFDSRVEVVPWPGEDCGGFDLASLIILAVPIDRARSSIAALAPWIHPHHRIVHFSRGLTGATLRPMSAIIRRHSACRQIGVLAGPLTPELIVGSQPVAAVLGTDFPALAADLRRALAGAALHLEEGHGLEDVEWTSALTGLGLFVLGLARGLGAPPERLAVVGTAVMAELRRLAVALAVDEACFFGLAGTGDVMAALAGGQRDETSLGQRIARAQTMSRYRAPAMDPGSLAANLAPLSRRVLERARRVGVTMPIARCVEQVLSGELPVREFVEALCDGSVLEHRSA